jgi:hypothetical protein
MPARWLRFSTAYEPFGPLDPGVVLGELDLAENAKNGPYLAILCSRPTGF